MGAPEDKPLLSNEHFSVDGTLLQAWASHASLERIDCKEDPPPPPSGPGEGLGRRKPGRKRAKGDFRCIKLSNKTHRSNVDPDALEIQCPPSFAQLPRACAHGQLPLAAMAMAADVSGAHKKTIGADKNYDTRGFLAEMRRIGATPHVAQNTSRSGGSAIDGHPP